MQKSIYYLLIGVFTSFLFSEIVLSLDQKREFPGAWKKGNNNPLNKELQENLSSQPKTKDPNFVHPGFPEWKLEKPILTHYSVLHKKEKKNYPAIIRPLTPKDIPQLNKHWKCKANFDWPELIDPEISEKIKKGLSCKWEVFTPAPVVLINFLEEHLKNIPSQEEEKESIAQFISEIPLPNQMDDDVIVYGAEVNYKGKKFIEGMAVWEHQTDRGYTVFRQGESRYGLPYIGVGTIGLAYMVQEAMLRGYIPYLDALINDFPDGRGSPIEFFKSNGMVPIEQKPTFTKAQIEICKLWIKGFMGIDVPTKLIEDAAKSGTIYMIYPSPKSAIDFLNKVKGYIESPEIKK